MKKTKYYIEEEKRTNLGIGITRIVLGIIIILGCIITEVHMVEQISYKDVMLINVAVTLIILSIFLICYGVGDINKIEIIKIPVKKR